MLKKIISMSLVVGLLFGSFGFSQFGVDNVELEDLNDGYQEDIDDLEDDLEEEINNDNDDGKRKIVYRRVEVDDSDTIRQLKRENKDLKDALAALEKRLERLEGNSDEKNNQVTSKKYPYSSMLTDEGIKALDYIEPGIVTYANKKNIYQSRVSKASLKLINSGEESISVYLLDLNLNVKELLTVTSKNIAYNELISIRLYFNDSRIMEKVIIVRGQ